MCIVHILQILHFFTNLGVGGPLNVGAQSAPPLIRHWRHVYMGVVTRAHPVRCESHIQRNPDREVATPPQTSLQATSN